MENVLVERKIEKRAVSVEETVQQELNPYSYL